MNDSYPFPTYSGLLEPKHYKHIGSALWLFLWCISSTTREIEKEGVVWGVVLGNKPVKTVELADQFGVNEKTIRRWVDILANHGYVRITRAPNGLIFTVRNSKKFTDKNVRSLENERTKMSDLSGSERTKMSDQPDKNVRSNKDITEINKAAVVLKDPDEIIRISQEIEAHFVMRRGKGLVASPSDFEEIKKMVADGVPLSIIKTCIDRAFDEYKPRHKRDEIRSISYCIPRCYDEWSKLQIDETITGAVPHVPVALGSSSTFRNRNQAQLDDLDKLIEEEMHHGDRASSHAL